MNCLMLLLASARKANDANLVAFLEKELLETELSAMRKTGR